MDSNFKYRVLVTGFGPFDNHAINASWEAVKELEKLWANSEEVKDVELITKQLPVSYNDVCEFTPKLWKCYDPIVVLHVGVSSIADHLTIEQRACSKGYVKPDIYGDCPNESNVAGNITETYFDVNNICDAVNESTEKTGCRACISQDAGKFLCEYLFYQSLCIDPRRVLFVHVPIRDKYPSVQTAKGLYDILFYMMKRSKNN